MKSYLAAVKYKQIQRGLRDPEILGGICHKRSKESEAGISEAQTSYYSGNPGQVEGSLEQKLEGPGC